MNNLNCYIIPLSNKKINQKFNINVTNNEKINVFDGNKNLKFDENKSFEKIKEFYQKYEKELNSFKMSGLMKIFNETGICVYRVFRYPNKNNIDNRNFDIGRLILNPTSFYYRNYENGSNMEYIRKKYRKEEKILTKLMEKEIKCDEDKSIKNEKYGYFFVDLEVISIVDKLGNDDTGIYIINNDKKEYVCLYEELD